MLHQNDVAVADAEADVVLDVVEEHTSQRRDGDVSRGNLAARQTLIETGKPPLVVEDMAEERIFIGSFRLHAHASSLFAFIISCRKICRQSPRNKHLNDCKPF